MSCVYIHTRSRAKEKEEQVLWISDYYSNLLGDVPIQDASYHEAYVSKLMVVTVLCITEDISAIHRFYRTTAYISKLIMVELLFL